MKRLLLLMGAAVTAWNGDRAFAFSDVPGESCDVAQQRWAATAQPGDPYPKACDKRLQRERAKQEKAESPEAAAPPTLRDAAANFSTLVENYVKESADGEGKIQLDDPATGRSVPVRLLSAEPGSLRDLGQGRYAGRVILRGPGGKKLVAEATVDLGAADWRVIRLAVLRSVRKDSGKKHSPIPHSGQ